MKRANGIDTQRRSFKDNSQYFAECCFDGIAEIVGLLSHVEFDVVCYSVRKSFRITVSIHVFKPLFPVSFAIVANVHFPELRTFNRIFLLFQ
ncbi:hypothetical protein D3C87_1800240 [compost metagenome]